MKQSPANHKGFNMKVIDLKPVLTEITNIHIVTQHYTEFYENINDVDIEKYFDCEVRGIYADSEDVISILIK